MHPYWLEQTESDLPAENDWLGAAEADRLSGMRFPKRRADWRLGRWTAKHAVARYVGSPNDSQALSAIEIRSMPSGAPEAFLEGRPAALSISLSHRDGVAACAVAPCGVALGCDLELIESHSAAFAADYFTTREQALVARTSEAGRPALLTLLWSAKESALKTLRTGLRVDTRCVEVSHLDARRHGLNPWRPLRVRYLEFEAFHGWWLDGGGFVRTIVAAQPVAAPVLM